MLPHLTIHSNFLPPLSHSRCLSSGEKYARPETPYIHVYTFKGWDRWRKRTRALRNTRLAFCRAVSAFIKESLAPSLSSASSSSPRLIRSSRLVSHLSIFFPPFLPFAPSSSSSSAFERISALRFFVLSSCCSPSSLVVLLFLFYNFFCLLFRMWKIERLHREVLCIKILKKDIFRNPNQLIYFRRL